MLILGINAFHGDAAAAALVDGRLVAAAEEERFTRIKHEAGFPSQALRYVAEAVGLSAGEKPLLAVARDPWARIVPKACYALRMPALALTRLNVHGHFAGIAETAVGILRTRHEALEVHRIEHHRAHLASSFFVSPFEEAALFSIDGMGDFASAMWGIGRANRIYPMGEIRFPHSLGIFYTALTQYLGFTRYGDEYKVMGLASYGEPEFIDEMRRIAATPDRGQISLRVHSDYFLHDKRGAEMTWAGGEPVLGQLYSDYLVERMGPPRDPSAPVERRDCNLASSLQQRLEEIVLDFLRTLQRTTGLKRLCLAGGVAFNCVVNGKILENTGFDEVYIQSAAGDAGLAIGAAAYVHHHILGKPREFVMEHSYWGPEFDDSQIRATLLKARGQLESQGCVVSQLHNDAELCRVIAGRLSRGEIVGWFQGRMEWGPRALGNRSILADPRRAEMRDILNRSIKRRETFRPFAPSILEEAAADYFEHSHPSPFMLMAYRVRPEKRMTIPATTHIDGSGRLQTVNERQNPLYYRLISEFESQTGIPVLLNTSFNEHEPVVCSPEQALNCFRRTKMNILVLGHHIVERPDVQVASAQISAQ